MALRDLYSPVKYKANTSDNDFVLWEEVHRVCRRSKATLRLTITLFNNSLTTVCNMLDLL